MPRPHDSLFKFTFADVLETECLLRSLLPQPLAVLLRAATLETVPSRAAGPGLRIDETDLLFMARLRALRICILPLLEHKSYRDAGLLRQAIGYVTHSSGSWAAEHGDLPFVLPIVVHHGRRPMAPATWRPPAALRRAPAALHDCDPQLRLVVIDLREFDEPTLRQRVARPLACLTLLLLQHLPRRDRQAAAAALLRWGDLLAAVEASPRGPLAMEAITSYVLCVTELEAEELGVLVARILQKPTGSYVMSTANKLRAEGRLEGKAEGRVEGKAEGQTEARLQALAEAQDRLLRQLQARFGAVPDDLEARVRCGTSADIDDWSIRLMSAATVHEVFAAG